MIPLVLLFLAVGTSHRDAVNVKRESVYSITIMMHEIGGLGVSVSVASNRSRGCEVCNLGVRFCPDYECNTVFSAATEFYNERGRAARKNFRVTTYRSQATAIWSCAVVCVFPYKRLYLANTGPQGLELFQPPCSKLTLSFWRRDFTYLSFTRCKI